MSTDQTAANSAQKGEESNARAQAFSSCLVSKQQRPQLNRFHNWWAIKSCSPYLKTENAINVSSSLLLCFFCNFSPPPLTFHDSREWPTVATLFWWWVTKVVLWQAELSHVVKVSLTDNNNNNEKMRHEGTFFSPNFSRMENWKFVDTFSSRFSSKCDTLILLKINSPSFDCSLSVPHRRKRKTFFKSARLS